MSRIVTARSLASLNDIADTPPLNPPLQLQGEEPLILYIVRVPGSRDIFLTTMKPKEKVVSAHDVQSSLYYCHLTGDLDAEILSVGLDREAPQVEIRGLNSTRDNSSIVPRSSNSQHSMSSPPSLQPRSQASENHEQNITRPGAHELNAPYKQHIRRKPVEKRSSVVLPELRQPSSKQKILGPRPINRKHEIPLPPSPNKQNLAGTVSAHSTQQPEYSTNSMAEKMSLQETSKSTSFHKINTSSDRHITLIRRDPATDDQWNVGRISLGQTGSPSSPSRNAKRRRRDVVLELFGPGYTKFAETSGQDSTVFTSHLSLSSVGSLHHEASSAVSPSSPSMQNFTFMAPWRTTCTFSTTASGRVLKCYHTLPETLLSPSARAMSGGRSSSMLVSELRFNLPTLVEKNVAKKKENRRPLSYSSSSYSSALPVSPQSLISNRRDMTGTRKPQSSGLQCRPVSYQDVSQTRSALPLRPETHFAPSLHQDSLFDETQEEDFLEPELDLSLGQERAGGGFSGDKAKLGKLIIYGGQGLAMLDLLVSANMGVWFYDLLDL